MRLRSATAQAAINLRSGSLRRASACIVRYMRGGIFRSRAASAMLPRQPSFWPRVYFYHWERLRNWRPRFTSPATRKETGVTFAYQGQCVLLEWQS
jgi:hypothetical protein